MKRKITFKEVEKIEHLENCFALRYKHFNNPRYKIFLKKEESKIDLDEFDFFCKHWGVYNTDGQIIGYARIFQGCLNEKIAPLVCELARRHHILGVCPQEEKLDFPLFQYQETHSLRTIESFFERRHDEKAVELSRFVVEGGQSFRVSKFMVEAGLGIYHYHYKINTIILACRTGHERFWKHYGFRRLSCNETYDVGELNSVNLCSDFGWIDLEKKEALKQYARQFKIKGEICMEL